MNRWPIVALALAFPLLAHAAALAASPALALASIAALLGAVAWPMRRHAAACAVFVAICAALLTAAWRTGQVQALAMLPPVLITFAIAWQFAASLAPGRTPLVQRIVLALHADALAIPGVAAYTRRVTWLWALLLGSLCAIDLVLALLAVPRFAATPKFGLSF